MQSESRFIVVLALALGCCSLLYFEGLATGLPLWLTAALVLLAALLTGRWMGRSLPPPAGTLSARARLFPAAGIVAVGALALLLARKHGDWDAYYIWNLSARFLADPAHWKALFQYRDIASHTDYPLHVPATVAFLQRVSGGGWQQWAPLSLGLFYTMATPALLYFGLAEKHRYMAAAVFLLVGFNTYFLNNGVVQCADVPLSFHLLLAFIALEKYRTAPAKSWAALAGCALSLCAWTKNEGMLYALILLLCYAPVLFRARQGILPLLLAGAPAALTLLLFKGVYAPQNDLMSGFTPQRLLQALGEKERYKLTLEAYRQYALQYFPVATAAGALYLALCIWRQRLPGRAMLVFAAFAGCMLMVYVFSIHEITWHLRTSVSRILLQWYPAFWFVAAGGIAELLPGSPGPEGKT